MHEIASLRKHGSVEPKPGLSKDNPSRTQHHHQHQRKRRAILKILHRRIGLCWEATRAPL